MAELSISEQIKALLSDSRDKDGVLPHSLSIYVSEDNWAKLRKECADWHQIGFSTFPKIRALGVSVYVIANAENYLRVV